MAPGLHRAVLRAFRRLPTWARRRIVRTIALSFTVGAMTFVERPDGSLVAVSHWNKHLKGALVRYLLEHPHAGPAELARWEHPAGYRLDPERTETHGATTLLTFVAPRSTPR